MNVNYIKSSSGKYRIVGGADGVATLPPGRYSLEASMFEVKLAPITARGDDTLEDVPGSPADRVVADIAKFAASRSKFVAKGFAYKRGYLLHGPPGTGKTCCLRMVTERLIKEQNAVVIEGGVDVAAYSLKFLNAAEPGRLIVFAIEEFDNELEDSEQEMLKLLDGTTGTDFLVLATTNNPDKLPARVIKRPGRFDQVVSVAEYPEQSRRAYFGGRVAQVEACVAAAEGLPISAWKEIALRTEVYGEDPAAVGTAMRQWLLEEAKSDTGSSGDEE